MLQAIHSMLTGGYIIVAIAIFSYSCNEDVQFMNFNITVSKRLYWPPDIASSQKKESMFLRNLNTFGFGAMHDHC